MQGVYNLDQLNNEFELISLINGMIEKDPKKRINIKEIIDHPFFWEEGQKLSLLQEFSDYIESNNSKFSENFEQKAQNLQIFGATNWDRNLEDCVVSVQLLILSLLIVLKLKEIQNYRQYDFKSTQELIRVIRNKKNHYYELSLEARLVLGKVPDGVFNYFNNKFPKLFMFVYQYCKSNNISLTSLI